MGAFLWAMLCAVGFVTLGDPGVQVAPAVGLLVLWGAGAALLPSPPGGPGRVFAAALAVRAVLWTGPLWLSTDLYRYLWEGRAVLLGGDPYLYAPAWEGWPVDAIRARVNHPEVSSIYPPGAMALYAGIAAIWYHPQMVRAVFGLADAALAGLLAATLQGRRRSPRGAWIYALHPLGAVEAAGSGHLDALALLLGVAAIGAWDRRRKGEGGEGGVGWATLGMGVKLLPGVLLPTLLRGAPDRVRWGALAVSLGLLGLLTAPYLEAGPHLLRGLGTYAARWSFNGSLHPVLEAGLGGLGADPALARPLGVLLAGSVVGLLAWRRRDPAEVALWAGAAFVLLSPTVHPWYVAWAWVPALLCGVRAWTALATLTPLAYVVLATLDPSTGIWQERPWTAPTIYLPFFLLLATEWAARQILPGPWAATPAAGGSSSRSPTPPAP